MSYHSYQYRSDSLFSHRGFRGAVKYLIIINCAVFVLQQFAGYKFTVAFGLVPRMVVDNFWLWQPLSYMFLHGGFFHIFFNMFILWMFGQSIENQWGTVEFLKYYFITGLGAAFLTVAAGPFSVIPSIGASGAIYGLLVAFAMMNPNAVIYLYFLFPMKAKHLVLLFAAVEFMASFSHNTGVANVAHLGGMLTGFIYLRFGWLVKVKLKSAFKGMFFSRSKGSAGKGSVRQDDDLTSSVNKILEKILVKGVDSLTVDEREIMTRYSKMKKPGTNSYH